MTTIFITGSNGLIGKTLCKYLKKTSYQVKRLDINLPSDHADYGDVNHFEIIQHHLQDCAGIVHLAGISRVIWGEQQPKQCWQTNVIATSKLLESAYKLSHQPWIIYASSREVYGQQQHFPVIESAPLQPLNVYARSKAAAEKLVSDYQARGLRTAILRFSSVYGRIDDHADRVVPAFCRAAAYGKSIRVEGFKNTLDFTHVADVVDGIVKVIAKLQQGQTLSPIHLTTGQPTTLHQLANFACDVSKRPVKLVEAPLRSFDVTKFYGDPALAREKLGWVPKINLADGITQMVNDFLEANSLNQTTREALVY